MAEDYFRNLDVDACFEKNVRETATEGVPASKSFAESRTDYALRQVIEVEAEPARTRENPCVFPVPAVVGIEELSERFDDRGAGLRFLGLYITDVLPPDGATNEEFLSGVVLPLESPDFGFAKSGEGCDRDHRRHHSGMKTWDP